MFINLDAIGSGAKVGGGAFAWRPLIGLFAALPLVAQGQPSAPTGLTAQPGDGAALLRWVGPQDSSITGYSVRHATSTAALAGSSPPVWTPIGATSHHIVRGLANGTRYWFQLRATTDEGHGASSQTSIHLAAAPAATVTIPDAQLRTHIEYALGLRPDAPITQLELAKLTELSGSRGNIGTLAGLEYAVNLRHLYLRQVPNLDLSTLRGLVSLETLDLSGSMITDVSALRDLSALQSLRLDGNALSDISQPALDGLASLTHLNLADNSIRSISALAVLTSLTDLNLRNNAVVDVSPLAHLTSLTNLYLCNNAVADLSPLAGLTSLRWLSHASNSVADLSPIGSLTSLRYLDLDNNSISNISSLANLTSLSELHLDNNSITDVSPLAGLASLSVLGMEHNSISDIRALAGFPWLLDLRLGNNSLTDISALASLTKLGRLLLGDNAITNISALADLREVTELHLHNNLIADVSALAGLQRLQQLRLADNRITEAAPLSYAGLGMEDVVDLRGNPLSVDSIEREIPALRARGVGVLAGTQLPFFPAAGDPSGREGFVRVINRSRRAGEVYVWGLDNAGVRAGPARLTVAPGATTHFNSEDLESGNAAKGLADGVGAPSEPGGWRLELLSTLDILALSYVRTRDGFVASMHDTLFRDEAQFDRPLLRAAVFNPASNQGQRSSLRLFNPGASAEDADVYGRDDAGRGTITANFRVPAGGALAVDAAQLEHRFGDGVGKWQLDVYAPWPVESVALLTSPGGQVTNLSTLPVPRADATWGVPLFPAAATAGRQGFVRVTNRSRRPGEVTVRATDDSGYRANPVALALDAYQSVHLNSSDLERGNWRKGIPVGVGEPADGDWRLALASDLDLQVTSFVRHVDGFLTSMHDVAPWNAADSSAQVAFFNPGANRKQESLVRLINDTDEDAAVTIAGVDDAGEAGGEVTVTVPAGAAHTLDAAALEAGAAAFEGALGDGQGKWRLTVTATAPITVMSLLKSAEGRLTNLSSVPQTRRAG